MTTMRLSRSRALWSSAIAALLALATATAATAAPQPPATGPTAGGTVVSGELPAPAPLTTVSGGEQHSLGLDADGQAYAWGYNRSGQLGDGTTISRNAPVLVHMPAGVRFTQVSAGGAHSLALGDDGVLYAWGVNIWGQLGDGTTTNRSEPVPVALPAGTVVTQFSAGYLHSLALADDGTVYAWGDNEFGALGDGTTTSSLVPVRVLAEPGVTFTAVDAGWQYSAALGTSTADPGFVWAYGWGRNEDGQLGDGTVTSSTVPVEAMSDHLGPIGSADQISAGASHTMLLLWGNVVAWGSNTSGQLGTGSPDGEGSMIPTFVETDEPVDTISAGAFHSLARGVSGQLYAWGLNVFGSVGIGATDLDAVPTPQPVVLDTPAQVVSAGGYHSLVLDADQRLIAWGLNSSGQVGAGTSEHDHDAPVAVDGEPVVEAVLFGAVAGTDLEQQGRAWSVSTPGGCGTVPVTVLSRRFAIVSEHTLPAEFTYGSAPVVEQQPPSLTVAAGTPVTLSVGVSGDDTPTVIWQESHQDGSWADLPAGTSATLTVAATTTTRYRAVATNCRGEAVSDTATVTVEDAQPAAPDGSADDASTAAGGTGNRPAGPDAPADLARTGAPVAPLAAVAGTLLALGALAVGAARVRRRSLEHPAPTDR